MNLEEAQSVLFSTIDLVRKKKTSQGSMFCYLSSGDKKAQVPFRQQQ